MNALTHLFTTHTPPAVPAVPAKKPVERRGSYRLRARPNLSVATVLARVDDVIAAKGHFTYHDLMPLLPKPNTSGATAWCRRLEHRGYIAGEFRKAETSKRYLWHYTRTDKPYLTARSVVPDPAAYLADDVYCAIKHLNAIGEPATLTTIATQADTYTQRVYGRLRVYVKSGIVRAEEGGTIRNGKPEARPAKWYYVNEGNENETA